MKNSIILQSTLLISGLVGAGVGAAILFVPIAFNAANGIELGSNINLLSDIRGSGGALLAAGILIMSGAFVARLTFTATVISVLMYLSYGLSRILGMAIDGMPANVLVVVTVLEIAIGLACVFAFFKYREIEPAQS